jgi:hypothetical protein
MISKFHEFIMTIYLSTGRPKKFGTALQMMDRDQTRKIK